MALRTTFIVLLAAAPAFAGVAGYYQFPTIHGDTIVFGAEGDLWQTSTAGGVAKRLTTHAGNEFFPRFSPDGQQLAFSGEYQGNLDVYVMAAEGGEPTRLTWHPGRDEVLCWKPDGKSLIFRSQRTTNNREWYLFEVPLTGGEPQQLPFGYGCLASYSGDGKYIAFNRWSLEFRTWKRYRGGLADDIWVGDLSTNKFTKITDWDGDDRFPLWSDGRVFFLSDRDGRMNVFSAKPDGADVKQHTRHTDFDARWPDLQGGRLVYSLAGDLWLLDIAAGKDTKIPVELPSDRLRQQPRFEDAAKTLESYELDDEGKRLLVGTRGELWVTATKPGGRMIRLTAGSAVRERMATFSPDGKRVACITDETGEQELAIFDVPGAGEAGKSIGKPRLLTKAGKGWLFPPKWSPDGKHIAYADLTMTLYVVDAESGASTVVDKSPNWEITEYSWSPDGKWLAYTMQNDTELNSIWIWGVEGKTPARVTAEFSNDREPAWDPDGKYLYFIGARTFNPVMDLFDFEHVTIKPDKLYCVILAKDGRSPFLPDELLPDSADDKDDKDGKKDEKDEKSGKAKDKPRELPVVKLDVEGIQQRVVEFPAPPDNYGGLAPIRGKVFFATSPTTGLMEGWANPDAGNARRALRVYDLKKKKHELFIDKVRDYTTSADGKKLAYRGSGEEILVVGTDSKPGDGKDKEDKDVEKLNPATLPLSVEPKGEWAQIFRESWRLQRDFYWAENMAGVDWEGAYKKYAPLVARVSTRAELNDLIGQLIAELGTSHTYVSGGDLETAKTVGVGLLGADLELDKTAGRHRFKRILRPEVWETYVKSPLTMTHANVQEGEYLFAINGVEVKPAESVHQHLQGLAGKQVVLTVGKAADRGDARDVQIETLDSESQLRYRDWVRRNREYVWLQTKGTVGYFHLPNMGGPGLLEFIKGFYPQVNKNGLVIDIRFNGGGFVSQMLIQRLARETWAYMRPRRGVTARYPARTHIGPKAVIVNQNAGSDGDIFPESFKIRGLGPVIGMRTWGGVIGIRGDKLLVDGGRTTQPEFAWYEPKRGWDLENRGVEPDIEVEFTPEDFLAGRDPQLDRAIKEVMEAIQKNPPKSSPPPPVPDKSKLTTAK